MSIPCGFSVILPVYNRAQSIKPALDSVLEQSRPPEEVIVIDDGSGDDIAAVLAPYGDRIRLVRQDNAGVAAARNHGARLATQPWLTFQDSDDLWHPHHLAVAARDLEQAGPDVVCHLGDVTYVGEGYRESLFDMKSRPFAKDRAEPLHRPLDLVISGMTLQGAAIRADVFARLGGFDTEMRMLSDTAFFCQLALEGEFLVTGAEMAEIQRLEGDEDAITSLHRKNALYGRQMHVRILEKLLPRDLQPGEQKLVDQLLSGAQFRLAQVLYETDRAAARRVLWQSARRHPSARTGWSKALIAGVLGRAGYARILDRHTSLDRS